MRIETLTQSGSRCALVVALLGSLALLAIGACNESNGTERVPGIYKPEAEIDRMYPDPPVDAGM